jgi:hypothetical protein
MYVCTHTCMYMYVCAYIRTYMYVCTYICTYVHAAYTHSIYVLDMCHKCIYVRKVKNVSMHTQAWMSLSRQAHIALCHALRILDACSYDINLHVQHTYTYNIYIPIFIHYKKRLDFIFVRRIHALFGTNTWRPTAQERAVKQVSSATGITLSPLSLHSANFPSQRARAPKHT